MSAHSSLTAVGQTLAFVADDGVSGPEVWTSDGTSAGTVLLSDVYPGTLGSSPESLTAVGGSLFFWADDGLHGAEPWVSLTVTTTSTSTTTTLFSCGSAPQSGCQPAATQKAQLQLGGGKLKWKWTSSAPVVTSDFGNPPTTTQYLLCICDNAGQKLSAQAPADRMCGTQPCWKALKTIGFKYSDKSGSLDGLTKAVLKSGDAGRAKVQVKGGGPNLAIPALPLEAPVRVQLQQSDSSACWEATYSTPAVNTASEFKAKSD